jgi:hypothetical protein
VWLLLPLRRRLAGGRLQGVLAPQLQPWPYVCLSCISVLWCVCLQETNCKIAIPGLGSVKEGRTRKDGSCCICNAYL